MPYLHGHRLTPHYHEMTPFERRLARLDKLASKYHQKKAKFAVRSNETPEQRLKRVAEMKADYQHLQQELRFAETIGEVEVRLQEYRLDGRPSQNANRAESRAKRQMMDGEAHHSTEILEAFLRAVGRPKPSGKHTAHHIAPGVGKTIFAARARARLHFHGIRLMILITAHGWFVTSAISSIGACRKQTRILKYTQKTMKVGFIGL